MSAETNKEVVRSYTERVDADAACAIAEFLAPDVAAHLPGLPGPLDREGFTQFAGAFYGAFPDLRHETETLIAEGDRVVGRFTLRGTHRREFQGIAPTGRQVAFGALVICRIADGKLTEIHMQMDGVGLLQQLGAVPATEPAGA